MIGKRAPHQKQNITAVTLAASLLWLAACTPAATPSTTATAVEAATPATTPETTTSETTTETVESEEAAAEAPAAIVKLNLNIASGEEFLTIPNVGDRMVHEFEEYRPYVSIQQFRQEIGKYVDEAQVAAYEEYVYVPIVANTSDAETLQQLPGVTPEIAEALIAGRPYESNAAFLEALAEHVTPEELATGETYLESE
jgi:DNA uptake protein ComE-like DNA-binding protein